MIFPRLKFLTSTIEPRSHDILKGFLTNHILKEFLEELNVTISIDNNINAVVEVFDQFESFWTI